MSYEEEQDPRELRRLEKLKKLQELEEEFRRRSALLEEKWLRKQKGMAELLDEENLKKEHLSLEKIRQEERDEWMGPYRAKHLENTQKIKDLIKEGEEFSQQINKEEKKLSPLHFPKKNK